MDARKGELDRLRPLDAEQIAALWPQWRAEDALFVYASNAVEGSTLTLGETIVVLQDGITIGGKSIADHLDAINGAKAYGLMLDLARGNAKIDLETILTLHRAVVGLDSPIAGTLRDGPVFIRGSLHVPPNAVKVPRLVDEIIDNVHSAEHAKHHPVAIAARLHFELLTVHPFKDGNGRTARLLQNLYLIRTGYAPILIGPEEKLADPGIGDSTAFVAYIEKLEALALTRYLNALSA